LHGHGEFLGNSLERERADYIRYRGVAGGPDIFEYLRLNRPEFILTAPTAPGAFAKNNPVQ